MAIINEITLGDILYQEIDSVPTHSAPRGTFAILPQSEESSAVWYRNLDGSTSWGQLFEHSYGNFYFQNSTTQTNPTQNTWVNLNDRAWQQGDFNKFTVTGANNERLTLDETQPTSLFLIMHSSSIEGGSQRFYDVETAAVINNTIPDANTQCGSTTRSTVDSNTTCWRIEQMTGGDYINFGHKWTANRGGGPPQGYVITDTSVNVFKIKELITSFVFSDDFETGDFSNWNVVNDTQNQWIITDNKILNSGFESDYTNWNQVQVAGSANFNISTTDVVEGLKSAEVEVLTLGPSVFDIQITQENVSISANDSYTISFYAKSTEATKTIKVNLIENGGDFTTYWTSGDISLTTDWVLYEYTFTPNTTDPLALLTVDLGYQTGTTKLDSFKLTSTSNETNYATISSNGINPESYNVDVASVSHFYTDINIPSDISSVNIQFRWQCEGENAAGDDQYDYGRVFMAPISVTPVAGTQVDVNNQVGQIKYNQQAGFITENISLDSSYAGQTWRLIFSWRNDGSIGTNPPFCVDDVSVSVLR